MTIIIGKFFIDSGDNKSTAYVKQNLKFNTACVLRRSRENPL